MLTPSETKVLQDIYEEANLKPILTKPLQFPKLPKKSLVHQYKKPLSQRK